MSIETYAQTNDGLDYSAPKTYEIGGIMVNGADHLNNNTLISITGLEIGEKIKIPGDIITSAITKLWKQGLFADVNITIEKIDGEVVFLNIDLEEHSRLSKFKFKGKKVSKSDVTTLKEDLKLMRGKVLTQNLINNSINNIKKFYINKGFYNVTVGYLTVTDTATANSENLIFNITKGKKVKIKEIIVKGRSKILNPKKTILNRKDTIYAVSNYKLKKSMKETKSKNFWRFFKVSKFIDQNYEDDKKNVIAKYNEVGYRDARIISDTAHINSDNTMSIEMTISEGETYKFGDISFVGNTVYSSEELIRQLGIESGDVFDQTVLDSRLFGSQEGTDISSLYLDDGYLFFNATPIEVAASDRKIDLEVRVYEGKQARVNKVMIKGNSKTNDHVIMRELRTRPGDLFKRSDIFHLKENFLKCHFLTLKNLM